MEWTGTTARTFYYFEQLAAIPHGSGNMKAVSDYCMDFAAEHDLDAEQDAFYNVVIRKPASQGCEQAPVVMLQGHLDMVAVKDEGVDFDFMKDGLRLKVEGDWLTAEGTTLGADDGIAVAMCLAILEDDTLVHPALEVVLTTDEEVGLLGATAMDMSDLKAKYMLNMDCDNDGEITASCAGGVRAKFRIPVSREVKKGMLCQIRVDKLRGGHSGVEIHKNRVNGIRLLMETVQNCLGSDYRIVSLKGGAADNAIPAFACGEFMIPASGKTQVQKAVEAFSQDAAEKYRNVDPDLSITVSFADETEAEVMGAEACAIPARVLEMPNGVQCMTEGMEDLVETSLNLGILGSEADAVLLDTSIRSSVEAKKEAVMDRLTMHAEKMGASISFTGSYPGWPLKVNSELQNLAKEAWKAQTGEELNVIAIHAGLECGLFSSRIPGLDIIAYGPAMVDIHSTGERLSISSTGRCYDFTCDLLQRLAKIR